MIDWLSNNNKILFEVAIDDENDHVHICTIENIERDKYEIFDTEDCMLEIGTLDTVDIIELMYTGSLDRSHIQVRLLK